MIGTGSPRDRFGFILANKTCPPKNRYLFVILFLLVFSGCEGIQIRYVPLKDGSFLPRSKSEKIPILTRDVEEPYEELGIIIIRKYPSSDEVDIQQAFRDEAMTRGADAVIRVDAESQTVFALSPFIFSLPFPGIVAKGTAIRYTNGTGSPSTRFERTGT